MAAWPGGVDEERGEALHPPLDGHVIDIDAALGVKFFDVAVGQAVAEIPAHGQQDRLGRKPISGKRFGLNSAGTIYSDRFAVGHPTRRRNGAGQPWGAGRELNPHSPKGKGF